MIRVLAALLALAAAGCGRDCAGAFDPCCDEPDGTFCQEERACEELGKKWRGTFDPQTGFTRSTCEALDLGVPDLADAISSTD